MPLVRVISMQIVCLAPPVSAGKSKPSGSVARWHSGYWLGPDPPL